MFFLCACVMLTCHFHPFWCLPLNTMQSMFYAAILSWLASNSIYACCGAWKCVNPLQFFVLLTNKSMRKKTLKFFFPKKRENSIKPKSDKKYHTSFIWGWLTEEYEYAFCIIWDFVYHKWVRELELNISNNTKSLLHINLMDVLPYLSLNKYRSGFCTWTVTFRSFPIFLCYLKVVCR